MEKSPKSFESALADLAKNSTTLHRVLTTYLSQLEVLVRATSFFYYALTSTQSIFQRIIAAYIQALIEAFDSLGGISGLSGGLNAETVKLAQVCFSFLSFRSLLDLRTK